MQPAELRPRGRRPRGPRLEVKGTAIRNPQKGSLSPPRRRGRGDEDSEVEDERANFPNVVAEAEKRLLALQLTPFQLATVISRLDSRLARLLLRYPRAEPPAAPAAAPAPAPAPAPAAAPAPAPAK